MAHDPKALDCLACPALCCRQAGYVEVSETDIRRLAKYLGLTVRAFEEKHIVDKPRRGLKRIKAGYETCQFLDNDRRCSVYEARPKDCRGYVCWNQPDTAVFEFARFLQKPVDKLREQDRLEALKK
jgi:Fe-S-cluster containining protein